MTVFLGQSFPENQAEYCLMCMDREQENCPCSSYTACGGDFPLDDDGLEEYLYDRQYSS